MYQIKHRIPYKYIVDCTWEQWTSWSSCSATCGPGRRNRYRRIQSHEENGGSCDGASVETMQTSCGNCPDGK